MIELWWVLETVAIMLDTSFGKFFESSRLEKRIQNKKVWRTYEVNKRKKNTRRKLRTALRQNVAVHWESYRQAQSEYKKAVRIAKVKSWSEFFESVDKILELTRVRKILAKHRVTTEEPLELPPSDLRRTSKEALDVLFDAHIPLPGSYRDQRWNQNHLKVAQTE